ncbi:enoyl-CoA hydratase-related protein [Colwellia hornerae]|uniref:Enoyl-CoA hydratase n=1 Tax=Colwellia hornerae TaxID=89402 RepID=A0A5C6QFX8_9GAMM|nr:enoyl-CoA hydratase-related protein [Colwellia hornerae]TWX55262.1 enoyl-CoA hydratase [Colwellia hornerae]TWX61262.1 enoyl-CoA hydratase [Colwellia hornerae]TWX67691.1 enoyl-CoA hydratase [Colwellia hornerae]
MPEFEYLDLTLQNHLLHLQLARPNKANAMNKKMWFEIGEAYRWINNQKDIHVVVLSGKGKQFSSGADINFLLQVMASTQDCQNDKTVHLRSEIINMQQAFSAIVDCSIPTIAAIHGVCIGGAVDLISACDIRLASMRSYFSILETQLGIPADMGTLQRLHFNLPDGRLRELAYTSAIFSARQAKKWGMINDTYLTRKRLMKAAFSLANCIALLPNYAVKATKRSLNVNSDTIVANGLSAVAELNAELLQSPQAMLTMDELKRKLKK